MAHAGPRDHLGVSGRGRDTVRRAAWRGWRGDPVRALPALQTPRSAGRGAPQQGRAASRTELVAQGGRGGVAAEARRHRTHVFRKERDV